MQGNEPDGKKELIDLCKTNCIESIRISGELAIAHLNAVIGFAKIAINGALLLNGTAGIAILYNLKSLPREMHFSLFLCAIGAACAVCCAGVSYITQRFYFSADAKKSHIAVQTNFNTLYHLLFAASEAAYTSSSKSPSFVHIFAHILSFCACLLWAASVSSFFYAVYHSRAVLPELFPC